ncbi:hypothetical protein P3X46_014040 [Hevea brasiliensis]|uniref:Protein kinase domain-containing protein n=1 Tax=Hevea brasiliensis TaxID=3981 RepID=A0ABQ9M7U4_HEVBR|nr:hypothetical protein P3X46_014040 [Hevea brasiliensis]
MAEQVQGGEESLYNHGVAWWRGHLIGKGVFGYVYLANMKKPKSRNRIYPPIMAVKLANISVSSSLQEEKEVFNHLYGCQFILECYGEEITTNKDGEIVYNQPFVGVCLWRNPGWSYKEIWSILQGIAYIHRHGYVHCDFKLENVLLVSSESAKFVSKIGDFMLAKKIEKSKKRKLFSYLGEATSYMAPEIVVDHIQKPPSDIWAIGCIVFKTFIGRSVWDIKPNMTIEQLLKKIGDRYELPKIPPKISKDGKDFLKACLVKNLNFRFTTEMLLDHPFVSGLDNAKGNEFGEILDEGHMNSIVTFSDINKEFYALSYYEDQSSSSKEGSSSSLLDEKFGILQDP